MIRPLIAVLIVSALAACTGGEPSLSFAPATGPGTAPQVQSITTLLPVQP